MTWGMKIEQAAGNTSITITDTTVWVTWRVTEPSYGRETAMNLNIGRGQVKMRSQKFRGISSSSTEQLFPVTLKYRVALQVSTHNNELQNLYSSS
jgi:hypothetical protein